MTNLTPEALKALSEAAIGGTWTVEGSPNTPFYDRRIESNAVPNGVGFADADEAAYIVALVNAHRAGLLVHVDAEPEYRFADLYVEALAEIKATVDGQSDQPVKDIVYGLLAEIRLRADAVDAKGGGDE